MYAPQQKPFHTNSWIEERLIQICNTCQIFVQMEPLQHN